MSWCRGVVVSLTIGATSAAACGARPTAPRAISHALDVEDARGESPGIHKPTHASADTASLVARNK